MGEGCGYINTKGEIVIPLEYDFASNFSNGLAGVEIDEVWSIINTEGKIIVEDCKGEGTAWSVVK
jgi:serine/threonine-protein kinase